ncbi:hypothetical protein CLCR_09252 [Cladophialophora carrionii]|uniref:Uncharacterized protein n=1 Tax=Cladophialophora carrionii TaxID=86049 RepID=A0A1C1CS06_9EURO|nr:hypothetical protein CLCR_09252 [Cladophialophora carrionii]
MSFVNGVSQVNDVCLPLLLLSSSSSRTKTVGKALSRSPTNDSAFTRRDVLSGGRIIMDINHPVNQRQENAMGSEVMSSSGTQMMFISYMLRLEKSSFECRMVQMRGQPRRRISTHSKTNVVPAHRSLQIIIDLPQTRY